MDGDKAPGPDGFSMAFFKECWDVLRGDIMEVFWEFFYRGFFRKESQCFVHFSYPEDSRC
jgi:hypothetical protein